MSFWDSVLSSIAPWKMLSPRVTHLGSHPSDIASLIDPSRLTVAEMWRSQPTLRTVIDFRAESIAQLGLHVYKRKSDTDRARDHDSPLAQALRDPDSFMDSYQLKYALVGDLDLHDRAYWMPFTDEETGRYRLRRLPVSWVTPHWKNPWAVSHYTVQIGDRQKDFAPEEIFAVPAYSPTSTYEASPKIQTLKNVLAEQAESSKWRLQSWKNRPRVSMIIERPQPKEGGSGWSQEARKRFKEDWYAAYTGDGEQAGGTPVLEDGMTAKAPQMFSDDARYAEIHKLNLQTVAGVYHVNPVMVGDNSASNYSNVREFRKMLYGDTLGPVLERIQSAINTQLLPMLGMDPALYYAEFNIEAKMQGSFEEQGRVVQTMTGRPILTANEARAMFNRPAIPGGDELVVPLNVLVGGQASPTDSGSRNVTSGENNDVDQRASSQVLSLKAADPKPHAEQITALFRSTYQRQRESVKSHVGAGDQWWDEQRWDAELAEDLTATSLQVTLATATTILNELDIPASEFNIQRTAGWLTARSESSAHAINAKTREQLEEFLAGDGTAEEKLEHIDHVYDVADNQRADAAGKATAAAVAGFAALEVARQSVPRARKRWVTMSGNPRDGHAALDGEEQPIEEPFSNGLMWPGAFGDPEEVAGCQCALEIIRADE